MSITNRPPAQHLLYELVSERNITGISEPTGAISWDPSSPLMLVHFGAVPPENTVLTLTVNYQEGDPDELILVFNET